MRTRNRPASRHRRHKIMQLARGYYGARHKRLRAAKEAVFRGLMNRFRGRKERKRQFRRLWIVRINAAARANGIKYGELINALLRAKIAINRKVLADIALHDPQTFTEIVNLARAA